MLCDVLLNTAGSITGNTVTFQSTNGTGTTIKGSSQIDTSGYTPSGTARDFGEGQALYGRFEIGTAASGGTSVEFQVVAADDAALSTNAVVIGTTGAIAVASATAGARFACPIAPRLASKGQRYIGTQVVTVGAVTAMTSFHDIGAEIQDGQKFYASGFAVS